MKYCGGTFSGHKATLCTEEIMLGIGVPLMVDCPMSLVFCRLPIGGLVTTSLMSERF